MSILENCDSKTDAELAGLALAESDYFLFIMKRYEDKLSRYIIRISGLTSEDARDILQEVFIKIYYNLNDFDSKLKFSSWAYRIAHNETISELRRRNRVPVIFLDEEKWLTIAGDFNLLGVVNSSLNKEAVGKVLDKLDSKYRAVLALYYLEDKNYEEISDILCLPVNTVGTRINRAKKIFKKEYENSYGKK